jgi:hypothetical protein
MFIPSHRRVQITAKEHTGYAGFMVPSPCHPDHESAANTRRDLVGLTRSAKGWLKRSTSDVP